MSDYLPQEVWFDIFVRLSVKTLLRIRSVCKLWHSLIANPTFISAHINRTQQSQALLLRHFTSSFRRGKEHYLLLNYDQTSGDHRTKLEFPFRTRSNYHFRIVGTCNGLICLSDDYSAYAYGMILWNPAIRKFMTLPRPRVTQRTHGSYTLFLGFGFDSNNDYKVVRVAYIKGRSGHELIPPEVEVYTVGSGSWRSFNAGAPPYGMFGYAWSHAFVNGAVHWVGYDPCIAGGDNSLIVSFDMNKEVFREVMLPDCLARCGWDLSVMVLGDKLSVSQYEYQARRQSCSVWVMQEYCIVESWMKIYSIDMEGGLHKVIGFKNNEVLLVTVRGKLVAYDPNTHRMKGLGIRGAIDSFYADNYIESLVLLEAEGSVVGVDAITCDGGEEGEEPSCWPQVQNRWTEFEHGEPLQDFLLGERSEEASRTAYSDYNSIAWGVPESSGEKWECKLLPKFQELGKCACYEQV